MNWVRDRFVWRVVEPSRGVFVNKCLYDDSATIQAAAGLRILQVNHSPPSWTWDRRRFPTDLRDVYNFHRAVAERWKGKVLAYEPWNEADIIDVTGETGSEIAAMQKASYLGLKAGNPHVIACMIPLADHRRATLEDFHANRAWPYFDAFNFHAYKETDECPSTYADFRGVSAGRPLWVTEMNGALPWPGLKRFREPSRAYMAAQAERVAKLYAVSIHEGAAATFYFLLHPFIDRNIQLGLLRPDLTPRPGYVALAAVGRLLADACPLGKLNINNPRLYAYIFRAKPDGKDHVVLVAWATDPSETLELPSAPLELYDVLGRPRPAADAIELSTAPVIAVLEGETAAKLQFQPPPAPAAWLEGKPSPVVLQALWSKSRISMQQSACTVAQGRFDRIPIYVYNFGPEKVEGRLALKAPKDWHTNLPRTVQVAPGGRVELGLTFDVPKAAVEVQTVAIEGDFGPAGQTLLSFRLLPQP